ncbi:MAG: glycoside hydrolase family 2 [Ruminococcaceae bacterium]|nr:glycoside hydrolase family 2 [Oscillospiraceae bacterium]
MKTKWGENLDKNNILPEYPRPQMVRDSYLNLNGEWSYAITKKDEKPAAFEGTILVPFSPESELSGVNRSLKPDEWLWYERTLTLPEGFNKGRVLLHFGAVDQTACVYVNGSELCCHVGGYTPFSVDITDQLADDNVITVKVQDLSDTSHHSRGKQKTKRGGIWYTAQSGIWQTVWLESVPEVYIKALRITPQYDLSAVDILVVSDTDEDGCITLVNGKCYAIHSNIPQRIPMPDFEAWSPENPRLYTFEAQIGDDTVSSYFGMRKFSVEADEQGVKRLFLNGRPYFHNGLLDQGYYPDGILTPPSDEAMICDIETMKKCGFNMLRKHIKQEPLRWYYHCDRLGMLVWQDMINGGEEYKFTTISVPLVTGRHKKDSRYAKFGRKNAEGREQYYRELDELVDSLYNCVSIAMWVPFNEGWGQFDAKEAVRRILEKDTTRTIDHASGWHDQFIGDIKSLHVYFKPYKFRKDKLGRAVVLSEFGGYNCRIDGHAYNSKDFGYKKSSGPEELLQLYRELYEQQIIPAKAKGLCATVYTQVTDVEDEVNGLLTYDRAVEKLPAEELRKLNEQLNDR